MTLFKRLLSLILLVALILPIWPHSVEAADLLQLDAKGAIAMDMATGQVLYDKEADTPRPVASLSKIMTAFIIYEGVRDGRWSWQTPVPISEKNRKYAANDPNGSHIILNKTEPLKDLVELTLINSSNATSRILAEFASGSEGAFVNEMNARAATMGINARYGDAAGLKWNAVSPRACATLMRTFIQEFPEVLQVTSRGKKTLHGKSFYSVSLFYSRVPCVGVDGFKPGWMPFAGFCFAGTAQRGDTRVLTVILGSSGYEKSYLESRRLIEYAFQNASQSGEVINKPLSSAHQATAALASSDVDRADSLRGPEEKAPENVKSEAGNKVFNKENSPVRDKAHEEALSVKQDVSSWAEDDIKRAIGLGITTQVERGATHFGGSEPVTRAEFVAILMKAVAPKAKLFDDHPFQDVAEDAWYAPYVSTAYKMGITHGTGEDTFSPHKLVSREEMAALMANALHLQLDETATNYHDNRLILPMFRGAVQAVSDLKLMRGVEDRRFDPKADTTREQATIICLRLMGLLEDGTVQLPPDTRV